MSNTRSLESKATSQITITLNQIAAEFRGGTRCKIVGRWGGSRLRLRHNGCSAPRRIGLRHGEFKTRHRAIELQPAYRTQQIHRWRLARKSQVLVKAGCDQAGVAEHCARSAPVPNATNTAAGGRDGGSANG
jgi:hypothetical protein